MTDFRRANFIPMTADFKRLNYLKALYIDIPFALPVAKTFVVTAAWEANLPGLSFNLYDDIDFWWLLGMYNGIVDPITDVFLGRKMRAFHKEDAIAYLSKKQDELQPISNVVTV